jgi:hypothetical protein
MSVKQLLVLLNSPNRNISVENALRKTHEALVIALREFGDALGPTRAEELARLLKVALNLNRAKGTYEGLCEGRRLYEFESRIKCKPPFLFNESHPQISRGYR